MKNKRHLGFSLVELVVVMAIIGIVMSVAVPGVRDYLVNQRLKTASFNLVIAAMYARGESIARGIPIHILSLPGASTNLAAGWCVTVSSTADCSLTAPAVSTMRLQPPLADVQYVVKSGAVSPAPASGATLFSFNRAGRLSNQVKIEVKDAFLSTVHSCIWIDVSGSARTTPGVCP